VTVREFIMWLRVSCREWNTICLMWETCTRKVLLQVGMTHVQVSRVSFLCVCHRPNTASVCCVSVIDAVNIAQLFAVQCLSLHFTSHAFITCLSDTVCVSVCLSVSLALSVSVCLCVSVSVCLSVCQSVCLSVCQSVCLSVSVSVCLSFSVSVCLSVSVSVCLCVSVSVCLSSCQSVCLSSCQSVCLSSCQSVCLSVCLSVCVSVCLCVCRYCLLLVVTRVHQVYIWSVLVYNWIQSQSLSLASTLSKLRLVIL